MQEASEARNGVIHRGETRTGEEAKWGNAVVNAVYRDMVVQILHALGLTVVERGEIKDAGEAYGKL